MTCVNKQYSFIQLRRGSSSEFSSSNPILASGEPAFAVDTNVLKIGDGVSTWLDLDAIGGTTVINSEDIQDIVGNNFLVGQSGIVVSYNDASNNITIALSGIGTTIYNPLNNRVLTSDGTASGINSESNLTFDGNLLSVSGNLIAISGTYNQVVFNTSLADPDLSQGQLQWNSTEGTLDLGFTDTYSQHMGEELHYRVRNNTASTLTKGTAVYASGLTPGGNNRIEVAPFTADGSVREVRFMGLVTENISNGVNGYTTQFGYIRGIDTRGDAASNGYAGKLWDAGEPSWSEGDILYAHPTVAGKLTKVEPKHSISVAIILNRHQNQGKIFVRPTSYGHLNDNHDVNVSGVTNGQFLQYNSSTDFWIPANLNVGGTGVAYGSGTTNFVTKWINASGGLTNSIIHDGANGTVRIGLINTNTTITTSGTADLILNTNNGTNSGKVVIQDGSGGDIIIQPDGAGQIQASETGDSRGSNAIDLQIERNNSDDVASGSKSVICGGGANSVKSGYSSVLGGYENNIIDTAPYSSIIGGVSNLISTGSYSTICGGQFNEIYATNSTIIGGLSNIASGDYSSIIGGIEGSTLLYGEVSNSAGMFSSTGDAQTRRFILRGRDDASSTLDLRLDGSLGGSGYLYIPEWTSWNFSIKVIARDSLAASPAKTAAYNFIGSVENGANNGFDCLLLGDVKTIVHEDNAAWDCNISILFNGNYPYLNIQCSYDHTTEDVYWVAYVEVAQVTIPEPYLS